MRVKTSFLIITRFHQFDVRVRPLTIHLGSRVVTFLDEVFNPIHIRKRTMPVGFTAVRRPRSEIKAATWSFCVARCITDVIKL